MLMESGADFEAVFYQGETPVQTSQASITVLTKEDAVQATVRGCLAQCKSG